MELYKTNIYIKETKVVNKLKKFSGYVLAKLQKNIIYNNQIERFYVEIINNDIIVYSCDTKKPLYKGYWNNDHYKLNNIYNNDQWNNIDNIIYSNILYNFEIDIICN